MSDKDDSKDQGRSSGDKNQGDRRPAERTGHVRPASPDLVKWLEKLWTRGNPPDRLEVWWMLGTNRDVRKGLVFYENFKQNQSLNIEECTRLAGEMLTAAQNWTDAKRRLCFFEIAITDYHQPCVPLSCPIGPLLPRQAYADVQPDGSPTGGSEDEEDGGLALKPLSHKYLAKTIFSIHKTMEETHATIGDTMRMMQAIMLSQQSHNERLQNHNMALYEQNQVANDRATERTIWVKREEMKIKAIGSGLKVGENLLYSWFGQPANDNGTALGPANDNGNPASNDNGIVGPPQRRPPSPEQRLVLSFLQEAADEKLSIPLFGDWKDSERLTVSEVFAGLGLDKPGIFVPQQFGILLAVATGVLGPEALDLLLHDSDKPQAITQKQMAEAHPLLTQGMVVALIQIRQLRLDAREKREVRAAEQSAQPGQG